MPERGDAILRRPEDLSNREGGYDEGIARALDWCDGEPAPPSLPRCIQDLRDGKCWVYFIAGEGTPVKIGLSWAPHERLAALQTAHWTKLRILAKVEGDLRAEAGYHCRFAEHRLLQEWFTRVPEIEAEIARLATGGRG